MGVDVFQSALNLTDVIAQRIQEHIMGIQSRVPGCANSAFVINIENNLVFGAPNVRQYFEEHRMPLANHIQWIVELKNTPTPTMEGLPVIRAGSNTNSRTKPHMVEKLHRTLRARGLRVHKQWVQVCMRDLPDHLENKRGIDILTTQLNGIVCDTRRVDPGHVNAALKRPSFIYRPERGVDMDDCFMACIISIDAQRRLAEQVNQRHVRR